MGLHNIPLIKTGSVGFCKEELQKKLMGDDTEQGSQALAKTTIDGVELIALAYCGKSHHGKKSNTKKSNFYSYFNATDCVMTLDGNAAEKKLHYPDDSCLPSKFVKRNVLTEEYYDAMLAANIFNRHAQFLLGIEEAIHTKDIFKRIYVSEHLV
eukprot:12417388-Ditylum_brightwellii.AAC.1